MTTDLELLTKKNRSQTAMEERTAQEEGAHP